MKIVRFDPARLWLKQKKKLTKYNEKWKNSGKCIIFVPVAQSVEKSVLDADCFDDYVLMPFEYLTIRVPVGYDKILKTQFGDYMSFPPIEERKPKHNTVCDPDTPFKQYCAEHFGIDYETKKDRKNDRM